MAQRKSIAQIRQDIKAKIDKAGEYWIEKQPADMGNWSGVVEVPDTQNMVFVRLANGQVIQAFNSVAPNIYNWKVFVGRDKSQPWLVKVIEVRWIYNLADTIAYVLFHHKQHEYPAPDTVWVRRDQFMPLLVLPAGGFTVNIYGDVIYSFGMDYPIRIADQENVDLSSYAVTAGARYVLLEITSAGVLNYVVGTTYGSLAILYTQPLPVPSPNAFPVCAFIFYETQTALRRDSVERTIIDLRMFTSNTGSDVSEQWHDSTEVKHIHDRDEIGLWQNSSSAVHKISWMNVKGLLRTFFNQFYATVAHTHPEIEIPEPEVDSGSSMEDQINAATSDDTPANGDEFGYRDIITGFLKKLTWAEILNALGAVFDAFYASIGHIHTTLAGKHYLPFGVFTNISPITAAASPAAPYAVAVDRSITLIQWVTTVFVAGTNDGSNYWTFNLIIVDVNNSPTTIASFNTSAGSGSVWIKGTVSSFSVNPVTTTYYQIYIQAVKTGTPGSVYINGPLLEISV